MGLIPVGAIFKGFTFDGEDSKDYGVYISGEAVFNAPERAVDMIEIPGRNGAYALDLGRFENIEVRYPAGIAANNETDFATGISALRNFLASRRGYCRLEDEYNPDEYRLAVYKSGLEVTPAQLKAGEFEIVFDCMPQRFLKSGETAQAVTSGGTVTNPTLYPASPQLQVWGYGSFTINGMGLEIASTPIGRVKLADSTTAATLSFDDGILNTNDPIYSSFYLRANIRKTGLPTIANVSITIGPYYGEWAGSAQVLSSTTAEIILTNNSTYYKGTARNGDDRAVVSGTIEYTGGTTATFSIVAAMSYDGSGEISRDVHATLNDPALEYWPLDYKIAPDGLFGNSSQSALGSPLYFDLDIGEAWKEEGGQVVSVNNAVTIPAKLPTLEPGANTITFDNTISQFKVVPRWWRV